MPEALMNGRDATATRALLESSGRSPDDVTRLVPHQVFPGNRPTSTFVFDRVTPQNVGRLLALYEHKVFVQGVLFGVNSFDQVGVELGKRLAKTLLFELRGEATPSGHDGSTGGLLARIRSRRRSKR
jgi:glucose-6-phosphate isomerase